MCECVYVCVTVCVYVCIKVCESVGLCECVNMVTNVFFTLHFVFVV